MTIVKPSRAAHRRPAQGRQLHARRMAAQGRRRRQEGHRRLPRAAIATPRWRCARALDRLYDAAAYLAALFLIGTLVDGAARHRRPACSTGTCPAPMRTPATAWRRAGFLALAHTLKRGEHIRVTLILEHVGGRGAARLELCRARRRDAARGAVRVLQRPARVPVVGLQRHLDRQRRDAAVDPAARDGASARSCCSSRSSTSSCSSGAARRVADVPDEALHNE